MATRALQIIGDPDDAWAILGEDAHLYGDNGGDPDGNAWLPSDPAEMDEERAALVVAAGLGQIVNVRVMRDRELALFLGRRILEDGWDEDETVFDSWRMQLDDRSVGWAHYGAYGAMDSRWIVI